MDQVWLYIILIILLLLSAFFSASETIFTSVNIVRLESYIKIHKKGSKKAYRLAKDFERTLSTVLIGNNLVNILQTAIATKIFTDAFGAAGVLISTVVMTLIILIFGEYIPKNLAKRNPEIFSLKFAYPLRFFQLILYPITKILGLFNKGLSRVYKVEDDNPSVTEDELISIVEAIEEEGVLEEKESELIKSAIVLDDVTISSIYTKKEDVISVDINETKENILKVFLDNHYSRIPVIQEKEEKVIGILYEKDFLSSYIKDKNNINIKKLINKPIFVKGNMKISNLLNLFQERNEHIAVIVNNDKEALGIISLEDVLESLVGEIYDEHDEVE